MRFRTAHSIIWPLVLVAPSLIVMTGLVSESIFSGQEIPPTDLVVWVIASLLFARIVRCGVAVKPGKLVIHGYFITRRIPISWILRVDVADYNGPLWSISERRGSIRLLLDQGRRPISIPTMSGSRARMEPIARTMEVAVLNASRPPKQ